MFINDDGRYGVHFDRSQIPSGGATGHDENFTVNKDEKRC
jgi:hypothetical protein